MGRLGMMGRWKLGHCSEDEAATRGIVLWMAIRARVEQRTEKGTRSEPATIQDRTTWVFQCHFVVASSHTISPLDFPLWSVLFSLRPLPTIILFFFLGRRVFGWEYPILSCVVSFLPPNPCLARVLASLLQVRVSVSLARFLASLRLT